MKITNFTQIESWIESRKVVNKVYNLTNNEQFKKDYGLKDQIQRAAVSVMTNIAEGFDSGSNKSFVNFLNYSYRSASEVQSLLFVALDLNYISQNDFKALSNDITLTKNLIGGFSKYLRSTKD
jgi:four helix bundle protein